MEHDANRPLEAGESCPFCALWSAYQKSEVSEHMRGLQRESLLLARSILTAAIKLTEEGLGARQSAEEKPRV